MCGISCAITLRGHRPLCGGDRSTLSKTLDNSLETIKHRGPDANGQWISKNGRIGMLQHSSPMRSASTHVTNTTIVALGHNRLAIVDLNPDAEQPFHDPEGDVHAVVNGELYGHDEIREELSAKGYKFKSKCDSEIAIFLYKEHGLSFLSHLRGEFSLCLYDSKAQLFIAACDRYAIKPLYYTVHAGNLLVSLGFLKTYMSSASYCDAF
jgi:asparagine synthase (glutamine-hydrolysing)